MKTTRFPKNASSEAVFDAALGAVNPSDNADFNGQMNGDSPFASSSNNRANERGFNGLKVRDLASAAGCSHDCLERHFSQYLGITPGRFLIRERFKLACYFLMAEETLPICEVARRAGYPSHSGLCNDFKSALGTHWQHLTPTRFRRMMNLAPITLRQSWRV